MSIKPLTNVSISQQLEGIQDINIFNIINRIYFTLNIREFKSFLNFFLEFVVGKYSINLNLNSTYKRQNTRRALDEA